MTTTITGAPDPNDGTPNVPAHPALPEWPQVVAAAMRNNRRVAALLRDAVPSDVRDRTVTLLFKSSVLVKLATEHQDTITDLLGGVLGGQWEINCVATAAVADIADEPTVYLVVDDRRLGWAGTDKVRAHEYARNTGGVLAALPVIADYRPADGRG